MNQLVFDNEPSVVRRPTSPPQGNGLWFTIFSATLAAIVVGGIVLGLGLRAYVYWSIQDAANSIKTTRQ